MKNHLKKILEYFDLLPFVGKVLNTIYLWRMMLGRVRLVGRSNGNKSSGMRQRIARLSETAKYFNQNAPVNRYLRFSLNCYERADELKADVYCAHGVQALPAADILRKTAGGKAFCDVIEIPTFKARAVKYNLHPTNLEFLENAFDGYLRGCDGMLTVGWALCEKLTDYGPKVTVIPNYRYKETHQPSQILRERCGLEEGDLLVLSMSTTATGFETVLQAMLILPGNVHLVTLGKLVPDDYSKKIHSLVTKLGLEKRVHIFSEVPYAELTSTASGADVGLIVRDPQILNNQISLPNRIFDYMFSGVPVVAPKIRDIDNIIKEHKMGVSISDLSAQSWAKAIQRVLSNSKQMKRNALAASKVRTWESLGDQLVQGLGNPKSIVFVGYNDLTKNNRTMRMARTLAVHGIKVTLCTTTEQDGIDNHGIRYIPIPPS